MRLRLRYSLFMILFPAVAWCQESQFQISPYVNGVTNLKDGFIEAGPQFERDSLGDDSIKTIVIKSFFRLPLSDKNTNTLTIDRFTDTWRFVTSIQLITDKTEECGPVKNNAFSVQLEIGYTDFKYYPTGVKSEEEKSISGNYSYAAEFKYVWYRRRSSSRQYANQFRVRYASEWTAADEVGVVQPANGNGVVTTKNMVIDEPKFKETLSPAIAFPIYPGRGFFSYTPALYYDMVGDKTNDVFDGLHRLRFETWIFFHPVVSGSPNLKIGFSPFLSIRTNGSDDFRKTEYGGQFTIKFNTTFMQFF